MAESTAAWVSRLRSPDVRERDTAWNDLYAEYFDTVYRLAFRYGVPASELEDVVQSVFLVAHRRIGEIDRVTHLGAWLKGITVRVAADHRRWRRVRSLKAAFLGEADAHGVAPLDPELGAQAAEAQREVARILDQLSPKLRAVLVLVDLEQCTPQEAAEALGIPVNTVRSRTRLARDEFDRRMALDRSQRDD